MSTYNFSTQKELFEIAYGILEDYSIEEWSFGGITFVLEKQGHGLKLDFLYDSSLISTPYSLKDVFGFKNIKIQTPLEILARKLKHREIITIRDFVDFAYSEQKDKILTKLKSENIVNIDRFFEVVEQFNDFKETVFNQELTYLNSNIFRYKDDLSVTINGIIKVAVDDSEVVAFDEFIEAYREIYEEIGSYRVYELEKREVMKLLGKDFITYGDIFGSSLSEIRKSKESN
jgi:hypothetical protein